jgi:hypothetical protein
LDPGRIKAFDGFISQRLLQNLAKFAGTGKTVERLLGRGFV